MQVVEQALQRVQDELAAERGCRQKAEQERDDAIAARQEAEERLRDAMESKEAPENSVAPSPVRSARRATHAGPIRVAKNTEPVAGEKAKAGRMVPATDAGTTSVKQPRSAWPTAKGRATGGVRRMVEAGLAREVPVGTQPFLASIARDRSSDPLSKERTSVDRSFADRASNE